MILPLIFFLILGTAIGSFLNVVAYRSIHGGPIFSGRSVCPHCKHTLSAADLIPVISYIALQGKCRYCKKKISAQYPIVEAAAGLAFAFTYFYWWSRLESIKYQVSSVMYLDIISLIFLLFVVSVLIVLTVTDIVDGLLPNSIILSSTAVVVVYKLFLVFIGEHTFSSLSVDLISAFFTALAFFAIVYVSKEKALGGGDIKLIFLLGLIVGWPTLLLALFLAFLTGGILAAMLILLGRKRFGQTLPLGPFLNLGAFISIFWGQQLLDIYLRAIL